MFFKFKVNHAVEKQTYQKMVIWQKDHLTNKTNKSCQNFQKTLTKIKI